MTNPELTQFYENIRKNVPCINFLVRSPKGGKDKYVCPICHSGEHNDGALHYYKDNNSWTCFACSPKDNGKRNGGDVIELYRQINPGLTYHQAAIELARIYNITIPNNDHFEGGPSHMNNSANTNNTPKAELQSVKVESETTKDWTDLSDYFEECAARLMSPEGRPGMNYLLSRGIHISKGNPLKIGYDPISDPGGKGHSTARIIFPANQYYYTARAIALPSDSPYKALNPAGVPVEIFNRGALVDGSTIVFITESAFDCLSIEECGQRAIGLNSTSNISRFIELISLNPPNGKFFILALDNDKAGRDATSKLIFEFQKLSIPYSIVSNDFYNQTKDPNEALMANREAFIANIVTETSNAKKMIEAFSDPCKFAYYIDDLKKDCRSFQRTLTPTGSPTLDEALGGGYYRGMYLIAGVPGVGKTAFSLQQACTIAETGRKVLYFELEMPKDDIGSRMIARSQSASNAINGKMDKIISSLDVKMSPYIEELVDEYGQNNKTLIENLSVYVGEEYHDIANIAKAIEIYVAFHKAERPPIVYIDYLQIINAKSADEKLDKMEKMKYILSRLISLRTKYNLTIICLSSTSRSNYTEPAHLAVAKESGDIEYSFECIFFLNFYEVNHLELVGNEAERNKQYNALNKQTKRHLELSCLKNRNGKTGFVIDLSYFPAAETFVENGLSLTRVQETSSNLVGDRRNIIDAKSFKPQPRKRRSKKDDIPLLESELFTQPPESCPSGQ